MNKTAPTALLIEDDSAIRCFVRAALEENFWQVRDAATLARGWADFTLHKPDLIVLDLGMPDGDSVDFIVRVRAQSAVPIIILAARVDESEKMRGLMAGANEYLSKLFGVGTRFDAALRRMRPDPTRQHGECQ